MIAGEGETADDDSLRVRLLADIRQIFAERGEAEISSIDRCDGLSSIEAAPWSELMRGS
jgi:hypothetical protein